MDTKMESSNLSELNGVTNFTDYDHVEDSILEIILESSKKVLVKAPDYTLKAVELANALRGLIGSDLLAYIREKWGGLLSLLEKFSNLFQVKRVPKSDYIKLIDFNTIQEYLNSSPQAVGVIDTASPAFPSELSNSQEVIEDTLSCDESLSTDSATYSQLPLYFKEHEDQIDLLNQVRLYVQERKLAHLQQQIQQRKSSQEKQQSRCLHIGNVPGYMTENQLLSELEQFGEVESMKVVTQKNRRFAFVTYKSIEVATYAKDRMTKIQSWKSSISYSHKTIPNNRNHLNNLKNTSNGGTPYVYEDTSYQPQGTHYTTAGTKTMPIPIPPTPQNTYHNNTTTATTNLSNSYNNNNNTYDGRYMKGNNEYSTTTTTSHSNVMNNNNSSSSGASYSYETKPSYLNNALPNISYNTSYNSTSHTNSSSINNRMMASTTTTPPSSQSQYIGNMKPHSVVVAASPSSPQYTSGSRKKLETSQSPGDRYNSHNATTNTIKIQNDATTTTNTVLTTTNTPSTHSPFKVVSILELLCDEDVHPTQQWPKQSYQDYPYCMIFINILKQYYYNRYVHLTELIKVIRYELQLSNIHIIPVKLFFQAYDDFFHVLGNYVMYINPLPDTNTTTNVQSSLTKMLNRDPVTSISASTTAKKNTHYLDNNRHLQQQQQQQRIPPISTHDYSSLYDSSIPTYHATNTDKNDIENTGILQVPKPVHQQAPLSFISLMLNQNTASTTASSLLTPGTGSNNNNNNNNNSSSNTTTTTHDTISNKSSDRSSSKNSINTTNTNDITHKNDVHNNVIESSRLNLDTSSPSFPALPPPGLYSSSSSSIPPSSYYPPTRNIYPTHHPSSSSSSGGLYTVNETSPTLDYDIEYFI